MPLIIGILVCYLGPIAILLHLYFADEKKIKVILAGALGFIVFSGIFREQFLIGSMRDQWYGLKENNPLLWIFLAASTAGIFEETGRYITWKIFFKTPPSWNDAILFGFSHAVAEAMTSAGALILFYRTEMWQANSSIEAYISAVDRIPAYLIHIGFSMLVLSGILYNDKKRVWYSILLHSFVNMGLAFLSMILKISNFAHFILSALLGIIFIVITIHFKEKWNSKVGV